MTTTEELQLKITALSLQAEKYDTDQKALATELAQAKQDLKEINKPIISQEHYDILCDNIADKIGEFDFDDADNFDLDFCIDYDSRIAVESMSFQNTDEIQRLVEEAIEQTFKTID
jgi:hypothetical protein|tara:strand:+ start:305 stop:652 length:348 start_codon:yes stop_codon:yes gene_type:complete